MISVSQTPPDGSNRRAFPYPKERQAKALAVFIYPKFLLPSKILFARFFESMIKKVSLLVKKKRPGAGIASGLGKSQRRIVFAPVPVAVCEADHDPRRVFFRP